MKVDSVAAPLSNASAAAVGLRPLLRDATRVLHSRLDALVAARLLQPGTPREAYIGVLSQLHGFISRWEERADAIVAAHFPGLIRSRSKLPMIASDLRTLGCGDPAAAADPVSLPPLSKPYEVLGSMYVIEGSTLGGVVIAQRLRIFDFARGGQATAYFQSYGSETPARWRQFLELLERYVPVEAYSSAVRAAVATFVALEQVYSRGLACGGRE